MFNLNTAAARAALQARACNVTKRRKNGGLTLIELLIGITVGLLVILAAVGTLVVSRGATGTVSEVSSLQQQGSYALRIIGQQLRQTGSIEPSVDPTNSLYLFPESIPTIGTSGAPITGVEGGVSTSDSFRVVSVVPELSSGSATEEKDCQGGTVNSKGDMNAEFTVSGDALRCFNQTASSPQPIISNVAAFQVNYRIFDGAGLRLYTATEVEAAKLWGSVKAIEICLDLQGSETIPDASVTYRNCDSKDVSRGNRNHMVFRNVFNLRAHAI